MTLRGEHSWGTLMNVFIIHMKQKPHKEPLLLNLMLNVVIPSVLFIKLDAWTGIGTVATLLIALSVPLLYGLYDMIRFKKYNVFSIIGILSLLLTGGIGLLHLSGTMLAIKEASVPLIIGAVVVGMFWSGKSLLEILLKEVVDFELIQKKLEEKHLIQRYKALMRNSTYGFAGTFLFSSIMNFMLAIWVVTAPSGTDEFNQQIGTMLALSYPVIAIPSMIGVGVVLWYMIAGITKYAELSVEEILLGQ